MLIIIIIVQQMEATTNENQEGISVTIQMCLCFFYIIILHESLNFRLKWETGLISHLTFFWIPLYNFCNNMFCKFANIILYKK